MSAKPNENHEVLSPAPSTALAAPSKWMLESNGSSSIEIEMFDPSSLDAGQDLTGVENHLLDQRSHPVQPEHLPQLSAIIEHVPGFLRDAHDLSTRTYKLSFSPAVSQALQAGSAEIVTASGGGLRAQARNVATGRFVEAGMLTAVTNPVKLVAPVWDIMALITAQKYLSDINRRLSTIESGINTVQELLQDRDYASLSATHQRLAEIATIAHHSQLTDSDRQEQRRRIEDADFELRKLFESFRQMFVRDLHKLPGWKTSRSRRNRHDVDAYNACIYHIKNTNKIIEIILAERLAATPLLAILHENHSIVDLRMQEIAKQIDTLGELNSQYKAIRDEFEPSTPSKLQVVARTILSVCYVPIALLALNLGFNTTSERAVNSEVKAKPPTPPDLTAQNRKLLEKTRLAIDQFRVASEAPTSFLIDIDTDGKVIHAQLLAN